MRVSPRTATAAAMFLFSFGLVLFELALTRLFSVVLFASWAHLAIGLALMGISVGALAQHLRPTLVPDEGLEERLGWWSMAMGATAVLAVLFSTLVPVTTQWDKDILDYGERSTLGWDLVNPWWFASLLPVLSVPFAIAGVAFAGTFQRRKQHIALLYGADLIGGAAAALVFVPLLYAVPGPDVVFVVAAAGCLGAVALFAASGRRALATGAAVPLVVSLVLTAAASARNGVLEVRYSAGYSEQNITYVKWTPLTRLAIHEDQRGHYMLLDNASASEIVRTPERRRQVAITEPNRGLVWQMSKPPAKAAILAASAGPEVAVAQEFGYTGIEAIDVASEIGDIVAERYADVEVNPYTHGDTKRVLMDGRAAILHSDHDYDIIQMVHANLHSSAGQVSNAWSPALLETTQAFELYLSRLTPDGTLSFGRGPKTRYLVHACAQAMRTLGIEHPERKIVWVQGPASVFLAKKRDWKPEEIARIAELIKPRPGQYVYYDPTRPDRKKWDEAMNTALLTDDRPYLESGPEAWAALGQALAHFAGVGSGQVEAAAIVYHALVLQALYTVVVGGICVFVPMVARGKELRGIRGVGPGLLYVACLGYGYLAVETVLLHQLVLFVGHPTYAITVVILSMLLFSGIGSMLVERVPEGAMSRVLVGALLGVVLLGALQGFVIPPLLDATAFGLPIAVRAGIVVVVLAPLGLVMGIPFPLAMRQLRPEAAGMVPWAWAVNGWLSVTASMWTVIVSRIAGYHLAFAVALAAYLGAALLAPAIPRIGRPTTEGSDPARA